MEVQKFLKEIEKNTPQFVLLVGEEHYYVNTVIKKIKEKWLAGESEGEVTVLMTEPSPQGLAELVYGVSFFNLHTLVVIEQSVLFAKDKMTDEQENAYLKIYSNIPEHCRIIIKCEKPDKRTKRYKALVALAQIVECDKVKPYKLKGYFEQLAAEYNRHFESAAIDLLVEFVSLLEDVSLYFIHQEVEKIFLYAGERETWTKADIEAVFSNMTGISGFSLTRAMLAGDSAKTLAILHEQIRQGEQLLSIAGRIAWQMRNIWLAQSVLKNGGNREDVIAQTDTAPFFVNELMSACKKLSEAKLQKAMLELSVFSKEMRLGGRGTAHLEEIIINFCEDI